MGRFGITEKILWQGKGKKKKKVNNKTGGKGIYFFQRAELEEVLGYKFTILFFNTVGFCFV